MVQTSSNAGIDTGILGSEVKAMLRLVSGFKIGWKWGNMHPSPERFLNEELANLAIAKRSEEENVPVAYYRVVSCFLLEVQTDRGEPLHFDLGSPIQIAR